MEKYKDIIEKAYEVQKNAYAPYSNFFVGACVKTKDNKYFLGANVENASYGLTNCAERNAIFQTYSMGYRKEDIESICIVGSGKNLITPCGACRQVMVELLEKDTPIILVTDNKIKITNIEELLPFSFTDESL